MSNAPMEAPARDYRTDAAMHPALNPAPPLLVGPGAPYQPQTVYQCIVAVSRDIAQSGIAKSRKNEQQGYRFRGIDDVFNALAPLLSKYGLVILPRVLSRTVVERAARNGGVLFYVTVEAEFDFVSAVDGSTHTVKTYGEAMDSADKATNKAMSAAYKYAAFQTFCIPTEGDNDADATTPEPAIQLREAPASSGGREMPSSPNGGGNRAPSTSPGAAPMSGRVDISSVPNEGASGTSVTSELVESDRPADFSRIDAIHEDGPWTRVTWGRDAQGGSRTYTTKISTVAAKARQAHDARIPVRLHSKKFPYLDDVELPVGG